MATVYPCSFSNKLVYKIKFDAQIRGHHVSKEIWTTQKDDILYCKKDYLSEALDIDKHGIGTYKEERLVGHTGGGRAFNQEGHFNNVLGGRLISRVIYFKIFGNAINITNK